MYDCLVIGAGLFGAAATRHLSRLGGRVAVMGPGEPERPEDHRGIFASHYDQGRIVSATGPDPIWNALDRLSIAEYRAIEEESGERFHVPAGLVRVCRPDSPRIRQHVKGGVSDGGSAGDSRFIALDSAAPSREELLERHRLRFPDGYWIAVEGPPSGYINPREMIRGQLAMAEASGATVIRETAARLDVSNPRAVAVTTVDGNRYPSRKVLVATGAYANCFDLLSRELACRVKTETIVLGRVPESERVRLETMPPIVYEIDSPALSSIYLLPPIRYPDGGDWVKLGCNTKHDRFLRGFGEIQQWMMQGGGESAEPEMREAVLSLASGLDVVEWKTKRCLVTYTPSRKPFIDAVEPGRVYVAVGGNGKGAHPSDAIGRIAAELVLTDEWRSELNREPFRVAYADERPEPHSNGGSNAREVPPCPS